MIKSDIRLTRGELYALVLLTFVAIAGVFTLALTFIPAARANAATIPGMAVGVFAVAVIVLPMQRILARHYYGREMPLLGSMIWSLLATTIVYGGWWLLAR
jgi:CDP-diglyceride synthetase